MGKLFTCFITAGLLTALAACSPFSHGDPSPAQRDLRERPSSGDAGPELKSMNGNWKIVSIVCGVTKSAVSDQDWIRIDNDGGSVAYVSTAEEDTDHLCLQVQQFEVSLMTGSEGTTDGNTTTTQSSGVVRKHEKRMICRLKTNGNLDKVTYRDEIQEIKETETFDVHFRIERDRPLVFETDEPIFCGGEKAKFDLSTL